MDETKAQAFGLDLEALGNRFSKYALVATPADRITDPHKLVSVSSYVTKWNGVEEELFYAIRQDLFSTIIAASHQYYQCNVDGFNDLLTKHHRATNNLVLHAALEGELHLSGPVHWVRNLPYAVHNLGNGGRARDFYVASYPRCAVTLLGPSRAGSGETTENYLVGWSIKIPRSYQINAFKIRVHGDWY